MNSASRLEDLRTDFLANTTLSMPIAGMVILLWPLVLLAAYTARDPNLYVLGGAILMGMIWIPYGWAADDRTGMEHAIGRGILCYAAFLFVPAPYKALAISLAVMMAYLYSLVRGRRPPAKV